MTSRRPKSRASFRARPRRRVVWMDRFIDLSFGAGAVGTDLTVDLDPELRSQATVVRMIVYMSVQLLTINTEVKLSLGVYMCELDAFGAAVFADPDLPDDKPGWLWRARRTLITPETDEVTRNGIFDVDLKSRRKFAGEDMLLALVAHNDAAVTVRVDGLIRTLIMLR